MPKMNKTVHFFYLCIIISCFMHCCYGSEEDETEKKLVKRDDWAESHISDPNTVTVPVAVIYIFGIGLVFVILLLIFLIIILVKTKFLEIFKKNVNDCKNVETGNDTNSKQEDKQKSLKRLNSNISHSFEFKNKSTQYQVLKENDSNTMQLTKDEFGTLRTPTRTESTGNLSPRIMKGITKGSKGMPIILPEQMSQICKEVLTRTNKNDESTGSLQDIIAKEPILEDETEKKYASSPVLDLYDIPPSTVNTSKKLNERSSNKEYFGSQTEIHSDDTYDMPKELNNLRKDFDSKTDLLSDNIYDMPKELENVSKDNNENQIHDDNTYDLPKEQNNSNIERFDSKTQVPSNDIYDMPKELLDNAQINYVKPYFPVTQELKETFKKPDYASLEETSSIKEGVIDKIVAPTEQNAYDFPANTQTEGKLYINANRVL